MTQLIAAQLLLLAYRPDGTAHGKSAELDVALGGALLTELVLNGHVELAGKHLAATAGTGGPAHPELVAALAVIAKKPRQPRHVVPKLAKGARRRLLAGLVTAGVLTKGSRKVLLVVPGRRYPLVNPEPREEALNRLRAAVIDREKPDQSTAALASLVHAAGLARRIFPDDDQRAVRSRLKEIAEGDWSAEAVRKAIQAARVATLTAVVAAGASAANSAGSGT